ncbi:hypothetical protein [Gemmata palustris]|uniref:hypothetical protein n=1 Tax=Gemmata palustris TaxID=2822762 RepID=UPI001FE48F01|nr:hypothetical protein [Gemmata palustris]
MTEIEWSACDDPEIMLGLVRGPKRYRKLLLFAVACLERMAETTGISDSQRARILNLAESRADGDFVDPEPHITSAVIWSMRSNPSEQMYLELLAEPHQLDIGPVVQRAAEVSATSLFRRRHPTYPAERAAQAAILREIVGNPFRPVIFEQEWRTSDVLSLAKGIYELSAFDRMPILADALQDAGCDNSDILNHCRGAGLHVRGCWVVDHVLGKE